MAKETKLEIRLTQQEKDKFVEAAKLAGMSVSTMVRSATTRYADLIFDRQAGQVLAGVKTTEVEEQPEVVVTSPAPTKRKTIGVYINGKTVLMTDEEFEAYERQLG